MKLNSFGLCIELEIEFLYGFFYSLIKGVEFLFFVESFYLFRQCQGLVSFHGICM